VRLFVGVELDDAQRGACATAIGALQRQLGRLRSLSVRWIADENLHITLWFLGELKDDAAERVMEAMRSPWTLAPFTFTIAGGGAFPPSGLPRIVWLGVTEGAASLEDAYRDLAARFAPLGYEAERRPYHPHVTIGRVKDADRMGARKVRDVLRELEFTTGSQRVTAVTLFRSRLSPQGARYEPLLRVPLQGC
jgi:RNA 2',3'-cyclic 3'-phosphodiesterase